MLEILKKVRSHRSFTQKKIFKEELYKMVEGARVGASARNAQAVRFFCVTDKKICDEIFDQIKWAGAISWNPTLEESPMGYIVLCGKIPLTQGENLFHFDMGVASQNILLLAHEMGYGGCIIGAYNKKEVEKIIELPKGYSSYFLIALGEVKDNIKIVEAQNGDTKYYRDNENNHFVPKLPLKELIIGEK